MLPVGFLGPAAAGGPVGLIVGLALTALQGILSLFGGGGGGVSAGQLQGVANQLATAVDGTNRLARYALRSIGALMVALGNLLTGLLRSLLDLVKKLARALKTIYDKVLVPALKALSHLRKIMNDLYTRYLRPILNIIQRVRRVLQILRLFHVHWAGVLDAKLSRIEGKIIAPYLYVLRTLNGYGSWINLVVTAGGVMQRAVFINTMYAYQRDWVNMWWAGQAGGATHATVPPSGGAPGSPTLPELKADFSTWVQTDAGPLANVATRAQQLFATNAV